MLLYTERCLIRSFKEYGITDFMTYRNNMEWMKYQGFKGLTKQEYLSVLFANNTFQDGVQFAVIHKKTNTLIGDKYLKQEGDVFGLVIQYVVLWLVRAMLMKWFSL